MASGALGLIAYVYLPLRAATDLPMNLGHPVTLENFIWVVSAKVYARRIGAEAIQPMGERFADLVVILIEDFGLPTLLLAVLGLYLLLRRRVTWPLAYVWGVTAFVSLCGRAWLNPVRNNPDVLGYMLPGFAALVALAACAVAVVLGAFQQKERSRAVIRALGAAAAVLALLKGSHGLARASLADFHATDDLADASRRVLPARALVISTTPEMVFQHWGGEAAEQLRPDVDMLPVPFLGYGDKAALLERANPALHALLAEYERTKLLSRRALQALARERPVLLEADTRVSLPVFEVLLPEGLLYRVLERVPSRVEIAGAALLREGTYGALYAALGEQKHEAETRAKLLWMHYIDALYYAYHGVNDAALVAAERGLEVEPEARELRALSTALRSAGGRALDVRAFLVRE